MKLYFYFFFPLEKKPSLRNCNYWAPKLHLWQITQEAEKLRTFAIKIMLASVNYVLITLSIPQIYRA